MAKFNIKQTTEQSKRGIITDMLGVDTTYKKIHYSQLVLDAYKTYSIDKKEMLDLVDSIASIGLEQNLVVKETDEPNEFEVVSGHKRLTAIKYIFDHDIVLTASVRTNIEKPMCIIIPKNEDPLITKFRMHETNVHQRKGFTLNEIEDYINTIKEAKTKNLEVNGKQIRGKTRSILTQQFGFSEATAKKYIKVVNDGNEKLKQAINNGEISINSAYKLLMNDIDQNEEEKPKEKRMKDITYKTIIKSNKSISKNINKLIQDVNTLETEHSITLDENVKNKLYEAEKIINEINKMLKI